MDKSTLAMYVRVILTEKAEDVYLRNYADEYYGWMGDHWLGEAKELEAKQVVADAADVMEQARANFAGLQKGHDDYKPARVAYITARRQWRGAQKHLESVQSMIQRAILKRRQLHLDKMVTRLFIRYARKARTLEWNLFDARLPSSLRQYILLQLQNTKLSPTALVFLWLVVEENLDHGDVFQVKGLGASDYLARHALATSSYDINAPENKPSAMEDDYVRELQLPDSQSIHENLDTRSNRSDHVYDGLPQLGSLAGQDRNETTRPRLAGEESDEDMICPTCARVMRKRLIDISGRWTLVMACPSYETTCRFERLTTGFKTRQELYEHLEIHGELTAAGT